MTQAQPKYKPFDLEAAKAGAALITRDGRPAKFVAHVPEVPEPLYRVIVLLQGDSGVTSYSETGMLWTTTSDEDLFMAPTKRTVWVNLYATRGGAQVGQQAVYETQADAARCVRSYLGRYLGTFPLEYTE